MAMTSNDYLGLFESAQVTVDFRKLKELEKVVKVASINESLYRGVQLKTLIPWPLIAAIHFRESSQNFSKHLHNGDPLTERTVHVPKGRPFEGAPPFDWVTSAVDAFTGFWRPRQWDIPGCLEFLERYNGLGYQKQGVISPYLWNYTDKYKSGLFVEDGKFDPKKIEVRPGCVAILKLMAERGVNIDFARTKTVDSSLH